MIPHTFGESAPFSLGVEEELMILDARSLDQVPAVDRILAGVAGLELPGGLKTELFASVFETATGVCADAVEVDAALRTLRRASATVAAAEGLAIAAAGTHPFARAEDQTRRRRRAVHVVQALRRCQRPSAGRAGIARPRRHALR